MSNKNTITPEIREEAIDICLIASNNRAVDPSSLGVTFTGIEIGADDLACDLAYAALEGNGADINDAEWYHRAAERLAAGWTPPEGWRS